VGYLNVNAGLCFYETFLAVEPSRAKVSKSIFKPQTGAAQWYAIKVA